MAKEQSKQSNSRGISNAQRRLHAFLSERYANFVLDKSDSGTKSRGLGMPEESEIQEGQVSESFPKYDAKKIAEFRLNRLRQYRNRKTKKAQKPSGFTTRQVVIEAPENNWVPIGPSGILDGQAPNTPTMAGRTVGFAIMPGGDRIYAATANGGVWCSLDDGRSWRSLMDRPGDLYSFDLGTAPFTTPTDAFGRLLQTDSLACGAIALIPGPSQLEDVIIVGSGEAQDASFGAGSSEGEGYFGVGPVVSLDGGRSWNTETSSPGLLGHAYYRLAMDPRDPNHVIGATTRGLYRRSRTGVDGSGNPIYSWQRQALLGTGRVSSVAVAGTGSSTTFFAAQHNGNIFASPDGIAWTQIGGAFPGGNRISLATLATHPNTLYALAESGNVYRIDRSGGSWGTWIQVGSTPLPSWYSSQGGYDQDIAIAPNNINRIYIAGSTMYADSNGVDVLDPNKIVRNSPTSPTQEWAAMIYRFNLTITRVAGTISSIAVANRTYIGGSCHPDVHSIEFEVNNPNKLWVGCDGGIFATNQAASGTGMIFDAKNNGLQNLMMMHLGQHPTEESILYGGTQDNGGLRFTGSESWSLGSKGDCGYFVVKWDSPNQVLSSYVRNKFNLSSNGGDRGTFNSNSSLKIIYNSPTPRNRDVVRFYAPFIGTPYNPGSPNSAAEANMLAFGSRTPWISTDFGSTWSSIPNNDATDVLNNIGPPTGAGIDFGPIRAMVFATPSPTVNILYCSTSIGWFNAVIPPTASGTPQWVQYTQGGLFRYASSGGSWSGPTRIDNLGGGFGGINAMITDIAVDPSDPSGNSIYITLGGAGDYRHVWHCQFQPAAGANPANAVWTDKSGPGAGASAAQILQRTLDVQHNAITVFPAASLGASNRLVVGADIGIWYSEDDGATWEDYSEGLPDAAVIDLLYHPTGLLRASTHGRGVFERTFPETDDKKPVELFIRTTPLDWARKPVINNQPDPLHNPASATYDFKSTPDILIDTPDSNGNYQYPHFHKLDFVEFVDELTTNDKSSAVASHVSTAIESKVYVQVHNHSPIPANFVRVSLLLKHLPGGADPTDLPANYVADIQNDQITNADGWLTVDSVEINGVMAGFPKIAKLTLASSKFNQLFVGTLNGEKFGLLAVAHHAKDKYQPTDPSRSVSNIVLKEYKAAYKEITIANFTGTPPIESENLPLAGFISIPESATTANAPFDAFLADALRINDAIFHRLMKGVQCSPLISNGTDSLKKGGDLDPKQVFQAKEIVIDREVNLEEGVPLIWKSQHKITINQRINALGKGAKTGQNGDFGGSGGGGNATAQPGNPCVLPGSGVQFLSGGDPNSVGEALPTGWASRIYLNQSLSTGGASGGGPDGGAGGGIVMLFANEIEMGPNGEIDARGANASGSSGGGGGGMVVLVAHKFTGVDPSKIKTQGGLGSSSGGNGGNGLSLLKELGENS